MEIEIRYERLSDGDADVASGLFTLKGEKTLLIDRTLDVDGRATVIQRELMRFDLSDIYIKPYLRVLLEDPRGRLNGFQ